MFFCSQFSENKAYSCLCTWMTLKVTRTKQNVATMWKKLTKLVDLDEPTSFVDNVNLVCTQFECKVNEGTLPPETYAVVFWRVLISLCSYIF